MNFSGYVGYVTILSLMLTSACCLVARLKLELGLGLVFVSGWLVVMYTCASPLTNQTLNLTQTLTPTLLLGSTQQLSVQLYN